MVIASKLWPDTTEVKASANLRTALWRVQADTQQKVLDVTPSQVALQPSVWVDVHVVGAAARNHRRFGTVPSPDLLDMLGGELLPGLSAPWLDLERERLRIELAHLYEVLGRHAVEAGDGHLAVLASLAAIRCDPYRETSNELLVQAHLVEGNRSDALLAFRRYRAMLQSELGIAPSATFCGGLGLS
jgi:DNA-binding SARP family transcriptional activator